MEKSSTDLSRSVTKETNGPTACDLPPKTFQQLPWRDARFLGSPASSDTGVFGPLTFGIDATHAGFESTSFRVAVKGTFSLGCQPGNSESAPFVI